MKKIIFSTITGCVLSIMVLLGAAELKAQSNIWVTAYYGGWQQDYLPPQNIDYSALTHICHFAVVPNSNGTLDDQLNGVTAASASPLISAAHAAGKKVLITVGGWGSEALFMSATSGATRATFVSNLVTLMHSRGYDGIDVDWEPLDVADAANYTAFVTDLRTALNALSPRPLLTMATQWTAPISASVAAQMDQINLMTYDLAGAWPGWVVWHNSATYDGGVTIGSQKISCDALVNAWSAAGVPLAKLGIGIDFYGYVWSGGAGTSTGGATAPAQSWTTAPSVQSNVPYSTIMSNYYQAGNYHWDASAQASYLSIDGTGSANDKFISYDNEATCTAKVNYARNKHIGGVIIWELGGGYRSTMPTGQRDLLLQAVKQAVGGTTSTDVTAPSVSITAPANGATVSTTVTVSAGASDNIGVVGVQFKLDGNNVGGELTSAPYNVTWNTTSAVNGAHTLSASARDAAGNTTLASLSVTVSNTGSSSSDQWVYQEALQSPWINYSWSATPTFNSTEQKYAGATSIKVVQGIWGGLSLLSGNGSTFVDVNPSLYPSVEFSVYGGSSGMTLSVMFENNAANSFPMVNYGTIPANTWKVVSIPMSQLDPNAYVIHRLDIMEMSGIAKTFFVDDIRFAGNQAPSLPPAPLLVSPLAGATGIATNAIASWNPSTGAASYHAQVSTSPVFSTVTFDQSGITATTRVLSGLFYSTVYYWRVNATSSAGTGGWSQVSSFTTVGAPAATDTARPLVSFTAPANGATVSNTIAVSAGASDNVGVVGVQFKLDGNNVGAERTSAPYNTTWSTTSAVNGAHTLSASARDAAGNTTLASITVTVSNGRPRGPGKKLISETGTPGEKEEPASTPREFALLQNYPNPFNPTTTIGFEMPFAGHVALKIYDVSGKEVRILVDGDLAGGAHSILWDGKNEVGMTVASGTYLYRMTSVPASGETGKEFSAVRKLIMMK